MEIEHLTVAIREGTEATIRQVLATEALSANLSQIREELKAANDMLVKHATDCQQCQRNIQELRDQREYAFRRQEKIYVPIIVAIISAGIIQFILQWIK